MIISKEEGTHLIKTKSLKMMIWQIYLQRLDS
jgi:hypothetical protein